ncbi:MAG: FHA domain-containing protein [Propionibacteriaceae bacterium]|jgi:pSer/pThr/pTyr-binding forkhead associated (FHA) protein|nr:FHA domain-containing protein [Propionibacteriaceae bacterium]
MTITCPACGFEVDAQANYCPHCGASLAKASGDTTSIVAVQADQITYADLRPAEAAAVDALPAGSALLLAVRGAQAGEKYLLNADVVTVGRHPKCDIFLDDITVSRRHARFLREDGHFKVKDEGSLNGTYVNSELVEDEQLLKPGDAIQVGKYRLIFFEGTTS